MAIASDLEAGSESDQSTYNDAVKESPNPDPDPAPDGGFTAWLHVLLVHLVFFNTWGVANGFGVFQQYYEEKFPESPSSISWIGSLQVFFLFSVGCVSGRLADAGYFRATFASGVFLQLLGLFMTSLCTTYWQVLLAQAVCLGIGSGLVFCPALAVLSQYFTRYRAMAMGLAATGSAVGGLVYPVMMHWLIFVDKVGFPWTLRGMGFLMLVTYIPCLIWFQPRLAPHPTAAPWVDLTAFRELPFNLFTASFFLCFWGLYFPFFYLGTFASDVIGVAQPIDLLMVLNGVGIIGRGLPPVLADKWTGPFNLVIPLGVACTVVVYAWAAIHTSAGLYAFAVVYGLIAAALQALIPAISTMMTPDPRKTGTRVGMIMTIVSIANLTGPAICGAIINMQDGSYLGAQMFAGTSILLGTCAAAAARVALTGWKWRVKR